MHLYTDIRVRQALQMAIDLPTIAATLYGGTTDPSPSTLTSNYMTGWGFPYSQWPQDLKDQYAYNPTGAKKLLADAGYPNGFNTNIVVVPEVNMDVLQAVKAYFAVIGVNMDIRVMDDPLGILMYWSVTKMTSCPNVSGNNWFDLLSTQASYQVCIGNGSNIPLVNDPVYNAFGPAAQNATSSDVLKQ